MAGGGTILHARITLQAQDLILFCHTLNTGPMCTLIISSSLFDLYISLLQEQRNNIYKRQAEWWLHMKVSVKVFDHFSQQFLLFLSLYFNLRMKLENGVHSPLPSHLQGFPCIHSSTYSIWSWVDYDHLFRFMQDLKLQPLPSPPPPLCWISKVRMLTCSWKKLHSQLLTWFVLNNSYYKRTCGLPQWSVWSGLSLTDMFQLCYSEGWDLWTPRSHRTPMIAEPL